MRVGARPQTIDEALDWHSAITDSVTAHRSFVQSNLFIDAPAGRFFGLDRSEIDDFFRNEQAEIDSMCVVNIVAAVEAAIRSDFHDRVRRNRNDGLSRAYVTYYRKLSQPKKSRPNFDEDGILDVLKNAHVIADHLVTNFRRALRVRHWYAHGRYWLLHMNPIDRPIDVHAISKGLLDALAAI